MVLAVLVLTAATEQTGCSTAMQCKSSKPFLKLRKHFVDVAGCSRCSSPIFNLHLPSFKKKKIVGLAYQNWTQGELHLPIAPWCVRSTTSLEIWNGGTLIPLRTHQCKHGNTPLPERMNGFFERLWQWNAIVYRSSILSCTDGLTSGSSGASQFFLLNGMWSLTLNIKISGE